MVQASELVEALAPHPAGDDESHIDNRFDCQTTRGKGISLSLVD